MKKIIIFFIVFISVLTARGAYADKVIYDFNINIGINADASLSVAETIVYDFGADVKRGIFRDIRHKYKLPSGNLKLRMSEFRVDDGSGNPYPFELSDKGDYKRLKIGDPDKTVTGTLTYRIQYKVGRAINFFSDHDELYWNTTGNDWQLPIKQVKAEVTLPRSVKEADLKTKCFAGPAASSEECVSTRYVYEKGDLVSGFVFINDIMEPGEGQTIVVSLPKGVISNPSFLAIAAETARDNGIVVLPLLVLAGMYFLWSKRGRDSKGRGTIIAQYDAPDGLSPAQAGTIIDEQAQTRDVSAEIINLAVKGYLKIERFERKGIIKSAEDYNLTKLKDADSALNEIEKNIMEALFKGGKSLVALSELEEKFYKDLKDIKKKIYKGMADKGYFTGNPRLVRGFYFTMGAIVFFAGWFIRPAFGFIGTGSMALSGLIIVLFGFLMPAKTAKGAAAKEYILGLKRYLSVAEKDRINFHNAPSKNPKHFEKLLPYAMILGVEKEWAKQFESIYREQPSWYSDRGGYAFNTVFLASSLNSFSAHANSILASAPSQAAGGSSGFSGGGVGGGFGGGGGGSW